MNSLGQKIAMLRKICNYTQEYVSKKLNIDVRTLRDIENDIRHPTFDKIEVLAHILNCDINEIINYKLPVNSQKMNLNFIQPDTNNLPKVIEMKNEQLLESYKNLIEILKSQIEDKDLRIKMLEEKLKN